MTVDTPEAIALRYNETRPTKRIQRLTDVSMLIKSDNPMYDSEVVAGTAIDELLVVGRMVWRSRRMWR